MSETVKARRDGADWERRCARLFEELRVPARRMVRRAFGSAFDEATIEDIYSSAWTGTLRALRRRGPSMGDDELRSYLFAAVANHAAKELRRRGRKPTAPLSGDPGIGDGAGDPGDGPEGIGERDLVRDLLSSLPARRRAVMLLRYGWGLEPAEVCSLIDGLSPRAYRKEITRGVRELTERLGMAERGEWCRERRGLLEAFAAGVASDDEQLQARHHLSHCRGCREFVAGVGSGLHELGSGVSVAALAFASEAPGAIGSRLDGLASELAERGGRLGELVGAGAGGGRGAGAGVAGGVAKLAGLGAAGKTVVACVGAVATLGVCAVTGVIDAGGGAEQTDRRPARFTPQVLGGSAPAAPAPARPAAPAAAAEGSAAPAPQPDSPAGAPLASPAPSAGPVEQEFGLPGAASAPPVADPGVAPPQAREFGP